jgi:hypothetical protein
MKIHTFNHAYAVCIAFLLGVVLSASCVRADTFVATGSMKSPLDSYTITLLTNGEVLAVKWDYGDDTNAQVYNPTSQTWSNTLSMNSKREAHTATLLPNGKVLVAGGYNLDTGTILDSAELYNPTDGSWTAANPMSTVRWEASATLLTNGLVLLAGGYDGDDYLSSAELYNPTTGTWTTTGSMSVARSGHTAILLTNGQVFVAFGGNTAGLDSAELYNPATGEWTSTTSYSTYIAGTATLLTNGQVLFAGGSGGDEKACELYNPSTGTWSSTGSLNYGRGQHTATLLLNGKVLVTGGGGTDPGEDPDDFARSSAEIYDPSTGTWTLTVSMNATRRLHEATRLLDGKVLIAGGDDGFGEDVASAEIYTETVPADLLIGFEAGTTNTLFETNATFLDSLVTAGNFSGAKIASAASSFVTTYTSPSNYALPEPVSILGTTYFGDGTRGLDHSYVNGSKESANINFTGVHSVLALGVFIYSTVPPTQSGQSDLDLFTVESATGNFATIEQELNDGSGGNPNVLRPHGGTSPTTFGEGIPISASNLYWCTILADASSSTGVIQMAVYDGLTFDFIGYSTNSFTGGQSWHDILITENSGGGTVTGGTDVFADNILIAFDSNAVFPLGPVQGDLGIPVVTAAQTALGTVTVSWTCTWGLTFDVEKFSGSSWSTVSSGQTTSSYTDTGDSDGSSYNYRVTAHSRGWTTGPAESGSLTINNEPFPHPAISSVTTGLLRDDFGGLVGFQFQAQHNMTVTALGRYIVSGNSGTHLLYLKDDSCTTLATVNLNSSGRTVGEFAFTNLSTAISLTGGNTYYVMSTEVNGGDYWYDDGTTYSFTYPSDFSSESSAFDSTGCSLHTSGTHSYGPVSFLYSKP